MAYSTLAESSISTLLKLLQVLLGLMWSSSFSHCITNVGSVEVTMFSITTYIVVAIGVLGSWWGNLGHGSLMPLPLCELGRLLLIGVSNMPPTIMNLLSSFGPSSLLNPSLVCLNSVSNSSSIIHTHKLMDKFFAKDTPKICYKKSNTHLVHHEHLALQSTSIHLATGPVLLQHPFPLLQRVALDLDS